MPSTFSNLLRLELQASGENETTWGDKTNTNLDTVLESAIAGMATITLVDANYTLTANFATADEARNAILYVNGTQTAKRDVICPESTKVYIVTNDTTGGFAVRVKTASGAGVDVLSGESAVLYCDGTDVIEAAASLKNGGLVPARFPSTALAWRMDDSLGINRDQPVVSGYGALGLDGTSGSFVTLFANGSHIGALLATVDGITIESVTAPIALEIGGQEVLLATSNGDVAVQRTVNAVNLRATANVSGASFTSTGGYTGVTYNNVTTGLGFVPVQQGSVSGYNPTIAVSFGYGTGGYVRMGVNGSDFGRVITDQVTDVFIKRTGSAFLHAVASNTLGTGYDASGWTIRECNYAGQQGTSLLACPRIAFMWSGYGAGQIMFETSSTIGFRNDTGTGYISTTAQNGYYIGTTFTGVSDDRLKNRSGNVKGALKKLCSLNGFYFTYNDTAKKLGVKERKRQLGLSAQEVKKHFPMLVSRAPCDIAEKGKKQVSKTGKDYMTVDYEGLVPVLVEAIKEQQSEIAALRVRISAMEKKL